MAVSLRILHTNDLHGKLEGPRLARLRELRAEADLHFDTGDAVRAGNLGVPLGREAVWDYLSTGLSAATLGNREVHLLESAMRLKLAGAGHPIVVANLFRRDGTRPFPPSVVREANGLRVGVLGVMVPMVTRRMKTQGASQLLWEPPLPAAGAEARRLRPDVDLLIALTHIGHRVDRELADAVPELDVILGGHSHTVLAQPERVNGVWIAQAGSHARFAGLYEWDGERLAGTALPLI